MCHVLFLPSIELKQNELLMMWASQGIVVWRQSFNFKWNFIHCLKIMIFATDSKKKIEALEKKYEIKF